MIVEEPCLPRRDLVALVPVFRGVIRAHIGDKVIDRIGRNIKSPPHHSEEAAFAHRLHRPRLKSLYLQPLGSRIACVRPQGRRQNTEFLGIWKVVLFDVPST